MKIDLREGTRNVWAVTEEGSRKTLPLVGSLLVVLLLIGGSLASPGLVAAQETGDHEATGEHSELAEAHGEEHHHKNHVAIFIGSTDAEEHHGEKGDRDFTIGIDYERRLSNVVGIGALVDWVVEDNREYMVGVPLFLHAGPHASFQLAPAFRHVTHSGEDEFVFRTGFMWDFDVGKISLLPAIFYDFAEVHNSLVFGLHIGTGF